MTRIYWRASAESGLNVSRRGRSTNIGGDSKEFKPPVVIHYVPEKPGGILEIRAVVDPKKPLGTVFEREMTNEEVKAVWPEFPMPNTSQPAL